MLLFFNFVELVEFLFVVKELGFVFRNDLGIFALHFLKLCALDT
jgi:hypothetical protein